MKANSAAEDILGLSYDQMIGRASIDPRWKAVDEFSRPLDGRDLPSIIALRTGERIEGFWMGIYNPEHDDTTWISVTAIPTFGGVCCLFRRTTPPRIYYLQVGQSPSNQMAASFRETALAYVE